MSDKRYNFCLGFVCIVSLFLFLIINDVIAMHLFSQAFGAVWCAIAGFIGAFFIIEFYRRKKRQA